MRVLTLSTLFPDNSRPRFGPFVLKQTRLLADHPGIDVRVVAPVGIPPAPIGLHPRYRPLRALPLEERWEGLHVYRPRFAHVPAVGGRFDAAAMARALIPLLRAVRDDFAFDVINAEFFFPDGPAATTIGAALGVPVSIKARGSDIHVWGQSPVIAAQLINAAQAASGLLAVSGALKASMVALGMPADKIAVHYTGVDLDTFKPVARPPNPVPLIVCVGNLIEPKGQRILIDALAQIDDAQLVLIGQGESRAALSARAQALGLADRVSFTGSLAHAEIAHWLAKADVSGLISTSEGLANAWIESLACGTPVVTTDVGGAREVITCAAAGRIVPPDAGSVAAAITELLATPPDREAVRAVAARFTWAANTQTLADHLRAMITTPLR